MIVPRSPIGGNSFSFHPCLELPEQQAETFLENETWMLVESMLPGEGVCGTMSTWNQQHLHKHMQVYSSDKRELGQFASVYEDSFQVHEGHLFPRSRYFPYE